MIVNKRPHLFKMVDILYDHHYEIATSLYPKGTPTMIDRTINKIACLASIEHCDRQILSLKENNKKTQFNADRFSDDLVYWIAVKEILKNKMIN